MSNVPRTRPKMERRELTQRLLHALNDTGNDTGSDFRIFFVGIRGYYLNTMGVPGKNDRNIYDDAIFVVSDDVFASFNANTDPSKYRKRIATLEPGVWRSYTFDLHKGKYLALCQRGGPVTVTRDGWTNKDHGYFGINIHRGSYSSTSSEGCQTIYPAQWDSFITLATGEAKRVHGSQWKKKIYTYVLLENY